MPGATRWTTAAAATSPSWACIRLRAPRMQCGSRSRQSTGGDERGGSILALYLLREKSSAEVMTIATQPATPPMSGGQPGPTSHAGSRWIARKSRPTRKTATHAVWMPIDTQRLPVRSRATASSTPRPTSPTIPGSASRAEAAPDLGGPARPCEPQLAGAAQVEPTPGDDDRGHQEQLEHPVVEAREREPPPGCRQTGHPGAHDGREQPDRDDQAEQPEGPHSGRVLGVEADVGGREVRG